MRGGCVVIESIVQSFSIFNSLTFRNILDIALLTTIFYTISSLIRHTKAEQLAKGLLFILLVMFVSKIFGFVALTWIIQNTLSVWVVAVFIIFQPEFRRILEHLGKLSFNRRKKDVSDYTNIINNIERAVFELSKTKTGALIVLARDYSLLEFYEKGTMIDGIVTYALLINSFVDGTPLHDGALIIQDERIKAGNCVLPLTKQNISHDYGTRHRAALGISEEYNAISVVVSEETGDISICEKGSLKKYDDKITFRADLTNLLANDTHMKINEKRRFSWENLIKKK